MTGRARGRTPRVQGTPGAFDAPQPDQRRLPQKPSLGEDAGSRGDGFTSTVSMASPSCGAEAEAQALCTGMGEIAVSGFESSFYASSVVVTRPPNIVTTTGFSGNPVNLVSNLFKLDRMTDFRLFQYHVDFKPDVPNKAMRKAMIQEHTSVIGKIFMFDGMILFLPIQLSDVTEMHSVHTVGLNDVKITLKLTNEIDPSSPICMQLYNIIFKRVLSCIKLVPIGRNYYSPSQAITVHQHKLEVWPGFVTSILQFEKNVMLIADMSHKILNGTTVWSVMQELFQKSGFNNQRYRDSCAKKLVGEIVLTRYNNKTYRLDDIDWSKNPESVFATDKMDMTFVDYYSKNHHITIHDKKQPLLISMPKSKEKRGPIALVPELCYLTGLSEEVRSDFRVMKDISVHTRLGPQQRVRALEGLIARINSNDEAVTELSNWHLDFARTLLNITSRQLPPEQISLGSKKFTCDSVVADWASEMRSQQLINPRCVDNWILMYTEHDKQSADDLVSVLYKVCPSFGMQVNAPKMIQLPNDNVPTLMSILKTQMTADTNLAVCILPTSRKDRYDAVEMICCIEHPGPSQLILSRTLMKKAMQVSVVTKLALQLNCKLGGELWTVTIPIEQFWMYYSHMIRPNDLTGHSDYHLFKEGIRPMWEDSLNSAGGKWIIRLKKGLASRCWENMILAMLGEQFMVGEEICGAVISVRYQEDTLSIWNRTAVDHMTMSHIPDTLKQFVNLPPRIIRENITHTDTVELKSEGDSGEEEKNEVQSRDLDLPVKPAPVEHPLQFNYTFRFSWRTPGKRTSYDQNIKKVVTFASERDTPSEAILVLHLLLLQITESLPARTMLLALGFHLRAVHGAVTPNVVELDYLNFESFTYRSSVNWIVMFYLPQNQMDKEFSRLFLISATDASEWTEVVKWGRVDCSAVQNRALCASKSVSKAPALKLFTVGASRQFVGHQYDGIISIESIISVLGATIIESSKIPYLEHQEIPHIVWQGCDVTDLYVVIENADMVKDSIGLMVVLDMLPSRPSVVVTRMLMMHAEKYGIFSTGVYRITAFGVPYLVSRSVDRHMITRAVHDAMRHRKEGKELVHPDSQLRFHAVQKAVRVLAITVGALSSSCLRTGLRKAGFHLNQGGMNQGTVAARMMGAAQQHGGILAILLPVVQGIATNGMGFWSTLVVSVCGAYLASFVVVTFEYVIGLIF